MRISISAACLAVAFGLFASASASAATVSPSDDILKSSNGGVADINGSGTGGFGTSAANLNDGNRDGTYGSGSVAHSTGGAAGNYMEVTIPTATLITSVNLFNRTDCCGDRIDAGGAVAYTLTIYNGAAVAFTNDYTFIVNITDTSVSGQAITLNTPVLGNVVRITENNPDYQNLAELEAFAAPEPASISLLGFGAAGVLLRRRKRL